MGLQLLSRVELWDMRWYIQPSTSKPRKSRAKVRQPHYLVPNPDCQFPSIINSLTLLVLEWFVTVTVRISPLSKEADNQHFSQKFELEVTEKLLCLGIILLSISHWHPKCYQVPAGLHWQTLTSVSPYACSLSLHHRFVRWFLWAPLCPWWTLEMLSITTLSCLGNLKK